MADRSAPDYEPTSRDDETVQLVIELAKSWPLRGPAGAYCRRQLLVLLHDRGYVPLSAAVEVEHRRC